MKLLHIAGARPNFMKVAPLMAEIDARPETFTQALIHTGQHYDDKLSQVFFDELGMPRPTVNLEVGSGSHAQQTAQIMSSFEPVLLEQKPDWVIVVGDVNSTVACALVCAKLGVPVAHVEAGLRSFDRTMPEEINRLLTDQLSDLHFTPSSDGDENLLREGVAQEKIHMVGNIMIDTLVRLLPQAEQGWPALKDRLELQDYILVTLHRPGNVDTPASLLEIMHSLDELAADMDVIFPVHPRTRARLKDMNFSLDNPRLKLVEPLGYLDFLAMQKNARLVFTDSGGVQEETTYLNVPCITVRPNTERPVTVDKGTNILVPAEKEVILKTAQERLANPPTTTGGIPGWDGKTAQRIADVLERMK